MLASCSHLNTLNPLSQFLSFNHHPHLPPVHAASFFALFSFLTRSRTCDIKLVCYKPGSSCSSSCYVTNLTREVISAQGGRRRPCGIVSFSLRLFVPLPRPLLPLTYHFCMVRCSHSTPYSSTLGAEPLPVCARGKPGRSRVIPYDFLIPRPHPTSTFTPPPPSVCYHSGR